MRLPFLSQFHDADIEADPANGGNTEADKPTFTPAQQELINRQIAAEKRIQRDKARKDLLAEFGVDNPDEIKSILAAKKTADEANKTESERLRADLDAEKNKATAVLAKAERALLLSSIRAEASDLSFNDPGDAWLFLDLKVFAVDLDTATVADIKPALEKLAKDKPYLLKADATKQERKAPNINGTARNSANNGVDFDQELARKRADPMYS